jgi:hypothetical protein
MRLRECVTHPHWPQPNGGWSVLVQPANALGLIPPISLLALASFAQPAELPIKYFSVVTQRQLRKCQGFNLAKS